MSQKILLSIKIYPFKIIQILTRCRMRQTKPGNKRKCMLYITNK